MNRILNFVVILLTTLSIVNALNIPLRKRATTFAACPSKSPPFNGASINPDPPIPGKTATAMFSLQLPATLENGSKVATDITDAGGKSIGKGPTEQDVCTLEGVTCPVQAQSTIAFEIPVDIPDDAPDTYNLEYSLVDGTGKEIACSSGPVTEAAPKAKDGGGDGDGGKAPGGPAAPGPEVPPDGDGPGPGPGPGPGGDGDGGGDGPDGKGPPKAKDAKAKDGDGDGGPPPPDGAKAPPPGPDGPGGGDGDGGPTPP